MFRHDFSMLQKAFGHQIFGTTKTIWDIAFCRHTNCMGPNVLPFIGEFLERGHSVGEDEGEVAVFSTERWDRRNRADLIESATPCHDAQVVGFYWGSNPLRLTGLTSKSEDYTTAPQHLDEIMLIREVLMLSRT